MIAILEEAGLGHWCSSIDDLVFTETLSTYESRGYGGPERSFTAFKDLMIQTAEEVSLSFDDALKRCQDSNNQPATILNQLFESKLRLAGTQLAMQVYQRILANEKEI